MTMANSDIKNLPEAYYEPLGDEMYRATRATMSPWDRTLQHGGPPTALLASCIEAHQPKNDMRLARITVDFMGPIPVSDLKVSTRVLRPGKRIELVESVMHADGKDVAVARGWRISFAPDRVKDIGLEAPPAIPEEQEQAFFEGLVDWGYGEATEWRFVNGAYNQLGPVDIWARLRIPLIKNERLTGLQRMLVIADSANGLSAELPFDDYMYVPPSINVTILKYPVGDWIFMRAKTIIAADGIGFAEAHLFDQEQIVGTVAQPLLVIGR